MRTIYAKRASVLAVLLAVLLAGCTQNPDTMLAAAKAELGKKDPAAATVQLRNALQKNPDLAEARFLLGKLLYESGDLVGAEKELRRAYDLNYRREQVVPMLARILVESGQGKQAIDDFGAARMESRDDSADLETSLAQARIQIDDIEGAKSGFSAALSAKPGYPRALVGKARLDAASGDVAAANSQIEDALANDPSLVDAWLLKGDIAAVQNHPDDALAAYRKAIEIKPDFLTGHVMIASILLREDKLDDVAKQLEVMKKIAPKHPQTLYLSALLAFRDQQFQLARDTVQQFLKIAPDNGAGLLLSARISFELGALNQAEAELKNVLYRYPKDEVARRLLIQTYLRTNQPAKALEATQPLLREGSLDASSLSLIGEVYARNDDFAKAVPLFEKAAALDPKNSTKRTTLGLAYLAKGDVSRGLEQLEGAAATDTGVRADLALIVNNVRQRKFDAALAGIAALQKKQPESPLPYHLRGGVLLVKGDVAGARRSYEEALVKDPTYVPSAASLANLDLADKKPDDAKRRFESVLAKDSTSAPALVALADLRAQAGDPPAEVAQLYIQAVKADPVGSAPRVALVNYYLRTNDLESAVRAARDALGALPDRPEIIELAARTYIAAGDANEAVRIYGKLVKLQPKSAAPFLRMAEAQVAAGDSAGALDSVHKALEIQPDSIDAQRIQIALDMAADRAPAALATARALQKQRPKDALGYLLEGDIHARAKEWTEAAAAYRSGLKNASSSDLAIRLVFVLSVDGNLAEADKFAAAWRKDHPKDVAFRHFVSEQAMSRKDYVGAAKLYKELLEIAPNDVLALNNLAWIAGQLKDPKAVEYAEKANALAPNTPMVLDTLGVLLVDKGETKRGIEMLQKAVGLAPNDAAMRLNLARALVKDGQKEGAKKELDTLAKLGDKFSDQAEVTKLMQGL